MDRITAQKFADVYGIDKIKQIIANCPQNCNVYRECVGDTIIRQIPIGVFQTVLVTLGHDPGMIVKVHENLRDTKIAHIDQNESDASFISRIATEHNAIATVKNNHLLFLPKNQGFTANGLQLPTYTIARTMCDSHDFVKKYSEISNVVTSYHSFNSATPIKRMASIGSKQQNIKEIHHIFKDEITADNHAVAELNRMLTNTASLSLNLAYGIPDLIPETPIFTIKSLLAYKATTNLSRWVNGYDKANAPTAVKKNSILTHAPQGPHERRRQPS